jgi:hypothetical protein
VTVSPFTPSTQSAIPTSDLTSAQIQQILDDVRFSRDSGAGPGYFTERYPELIRQAQEWQAANPTVYPAPAPGAALAPYAGPGVAPLQQVLLPDGRVVTGYAMTQAAPPATQPVVVERRGGIDPGAQKLAGAGVFAVGVGYGGSLLFSALAAAESALGALAVCLVIGWAMRGRGGGGGGSVRVDVRVTQNPTITATSRIERK